MAAALGWDAERTAREVEHYTARVAAERESQRMPDDRTADAARLGAPGRARRGVYQASPPSHGAGGMPGNGRAAGSLRADVAAVRTPCVTTRGVRARSSPSSWVSPAPPTGRTPSCGWAPTPTRPSVLSDGTPLDKAIAERARRAARAPRCASGSAPGCRSCMKVLAADAAAVAAGAPDERAGPGRLRRRGGRRRPARRPDAHLQGPVPQAGAAARADHRSRRCAASGRSRSRCTAWPSCRCPSSSRRSPRWPAAGCARRSRS